MRKGRLWAAELLQLLLAISLAVLFLHIVSQGIILDPRNIAWLDTVPDAQISYLGWEAFLAAPWSLPPGANPHYGLEFSNGVFTTEPVVYLALFVKALGTFVPLPAPFQYFGFWILVCITLQAYVGFKIGETLNFSKTVSIALGIFLVFTPPFLSRFIGHFGLSGHWIILTAIWVYLQKDTSYWRWPLLLFITALTASYILAMTLVIWLADLCKRALTKSANLQQLAIALVAAPIAVLVALWVSGFFELGSGFAAFGFGKLHMNLISPVNPFGWSYIIRDFPAKPFEYEGYNFFGLGGLLLIVLSVPALLSGYATGFFSAARAPLLIGLTGLTVFAVSNEISLGAIDLVTIPLPEWLFELLSIFRSSGRMFWPVWYFIIIGALWLLNSMYKPRVTAALLLGILAIQIADTRPGWSSLETKFSKSGSTWPIPMRSPVWNVLADHYSKLRTLPVLTPHPYWREFGYFAVSHGLGTDVITLSRFDLAKYEAAKKKGNKAATEGDFEEDSIYILDEANARSASVHLDEDDLLAKIDGFFVFARNAFPLAQQFQIRNTAPLHVLPVPSLVSFNDVSLGKNYLGAGWSQPERWGVWSDGPSASLVFRMDRPVSNLTLRVLARGFMSEPGARQTASVYFRGHEVGTLELEATPKWYELKIPEILLTSRSPLLTDPSSANVLEFRVSNPRKLVPGEVTPDTRLVGMGLLQLALSSEGANP